MTELIIQGAVGLIAVGIPAGYWMRHHRRTQIARGRLRESTESGMTEPVSLHPQIDPNQCIASGGCTEACPEGGIIGILDGKATLVSPTKCIGHGACEDACPVGAITLVFGTETRGVDIPFVQETFETNVPGMYISGELGGMGLIRNAITQGREAVEYIAKSLNGSSRNGKLDLLIVGSGPAGLAATLEAKKRGLKAATLEQEATVGGAIATYPRQKLVMTQPMEIPYYGVFSKKTIRKEELLDLWRDVMDKSEISVNCGERVESIESGGEGFVVKTPVREYHTRRVLLAIGRRGTPRRLGVPGENSTKVAYKLLDPEQYRGRRMLVVGGGDSAVEAALALGGQPQTEVTLSYRKGVFSRIKQGNRERLDRALGEGTVRLMLESRVVEIQEHTVSLEGAEGPVVLDNDFVLVFAGGELPTGFLQKIGVRVEKKFGTR